MQAGTQERVTSPPANTAFELVAVVERHFMRDGEIDRHERPILDLCERLQRQADHADESLAVSLSAVRGAGVRGHRFGRRLAEIRNSGPYVLETDEDQELDTAS